MPETTTDWRELAQRTGYGLEVTLLWSSSTNRVRVAVVNEELDEQFVLEVPGRDALRAFYHPYAHRSAAPSAHRLDGHPVFS